MLENEAVLESVLTCPICTVAKIETMPTDACQFYYDCTGCGALLRPLKGHCCVPRSTLLNNLDRIGWKGAGVGQGRAETKLRTALKRKWHDADA